jgi:hypothetical protein
VALFKSCVAVHQKYKKQTFPCQIVRRKNIGCARIFSMSRCVIAKPEWVRNGSTNKSRAAGE